MPDQPEFRVERDADCDCGWWNRWRIVKAQTVLARGSAFPILKHHEIVGHAFTEWGAWRKVRKMLAES